MDAYSDYVVIDIETSGLDPQKDEIIELSALKIEKNTISERFYSLVKPTKILTKDVEYLTGITNDELTEKRPINDILPNFLNIVGDRPLVAHNIDFDIKFLNAALNKAGKQPLENETIDTLKLVKNKYKLENYTLQKLEKLLGVNCAQLITFYVYETIKR